MKLHVILVQGPCSSSLYHSNFSICAAKVSTHFTLLAWRIPWTEEPDGLQSIGLQRAGHDQGNLALTHELPNYTGKSA